MRSVLSIARNGTFIFRATANIKFKDERLKNLPLKIRNKKGCPLSLLPLNILVILVGAIRQIKEKTSR